MTFAGGASVAAIFTCAPVSRHGGGIFMYLHLQGSPLELLFTLVF